MSEDGVLLDMSKPAAQNGDGPSAEAPTTTQPTSTDPSPVSNGVVYLDTAQKTTTTITTATTNTHPPPLIDLDTSFQSSLDSSIDDPQNDEGANLGDGAQCQLSSRLMLEMD